jgi:hypothetical protein
MPRLPCRTLPLGASTRSSASSAYCEAGLIVRNISQLRSSRSREESHVARKRLWQVRRLNLKDRLLDSGFLVWASMRVMRSVGNGLAQRCALGVAPVQRPAQRRTSLDESNPHRITSGLKRTGATERARFRAGQMSDIGAMRKRRDVLSPSSSSRYGPTAEVQPFFEIN